MADFRYGAPSTAEMMAQRMQKLSIERVNKGFQHVPQSFVGDGVVKFESNIVLRNLKLKCVLTNDLWTEVAPKEFQVKADMQDAEDRTPIAQSTFVIQKVNKDVRDTGGRPFNREEAKVLRYLEPFQLMCNPSLLVDEQTNMLSAPCYLKSEGSMYGKSHTVSMTMAHSDPRTHFICVPASCAASNDPFAKAMVQARGKPVECNATVCIRNVMSNLPLAVETGALRSSSANLPAGASVPVVCMPCGKGGNVEEFIWSLEFSQDPDDAVDRRSLPKRITNPKELLRKIREILCRRGEHMFGIREISRSFRILDRDHNGSVSRSELLDGLFKYGVRLDKEQVQGLFEYLDENHDGTVDLNEFLVALRGPIPKRRLKLILMAYDVLDRDKNGMVTLDELVALYDTSWHPDVVDGRKSHEDVVKEFVAQWDNGGDQRESSATSKKGDGVITKDEFIHYYRDVSASIDDDDFFELMIRNAWHISGGKGWCENTSNIRVLVEHSDGSAQVIELVDDFGVSRQDMPAIRALLRKQGVTDIKRVSLAD